MDTTKHYGLKKPAENDYIEVEDLNYNSETIDQALNSKVDKQTGKELSSNDYTSVDKLKLQNIEAGAQVNKIEVVKVNNSPVSVSNKAVNISVPAPTTVSNSLNNSSTTEALSAAQGKELKLLISAEERKRQQKDTEHDDAIAAEIRNRKSANENLVNLLTQKNTELQNIISEMKRKKESEDMSIENRLIELTTAIKKLQTDDDPANYIVEEITYSKSWRVPSHVRQVDVFLCSGGEVGFEYREYVNERYYYILHAGLGGNCVYVKNYPVIPNSNISCIIGAGGSDSSKAGKTVFGTLSAKKDKVTIEKWEVVEYHGKEAIHKLSPEWEFGSEGRLGKPGVYCELNGKIYGSGGSGITDISTDGTGGEGGQVYSQRIAGKSGHPNTGCGAGIGYKTGGSAQSGYSNGNATGGSGIIIVRYKRQGV